MSESKETKHLHLQIKEFDECQAREMKKDTQA